ncbi:MAG: type II toxin-antitoxin system mRNA interferase toxin, RelE/StbE family [Neisseriaceae bacterium]|nr:type II toxin-antitoxin system mRNA interferase toxin, RelE/StbE family [Neisseriaceae bacterium]
MNWTLEFDEKVKKDLKKLDKQTANRIFEYLTKTVIGKYADNPRAIGEALKGKKLGEYWKYRVGDCRVIAKIEDEKLVILVVKVGNRREVYKPK